jgi:hypothetical protein
MKEDPIVEEIRRYRKEHSERYDNDLNKIVDALKKAEKKSGRKLANFGPKQLLSNTDS